MNIQMIIDYLKEKHWRTNDIVYVGSYMLIASIFTTPVLGIPIGLAAFLYFNDKENLDAYKREYNRHNK
ncbi:VraH family peptide resistance protein [Macrococcus carouselicus]|uniref:Uncharacterized protein n=1 Tax=Macrococcus carouselicus TaxID=69969 RepID=A0A9Q8CQ00_9STAP|nr:hypothetical protein [Macrococcus carouselicus]TDM04614.1 hypothetical protein ERX40_05430 [Macrococcus carouselicus]